MKAKPALAKLVAELKKLGYKKPEAIVLRAFKWKQTGRRWIAPYNKHVTFSTQEALEVSALPFFLSDTARGRFDGIRHDKDIWTP